MKPERFPAGLKAQPFWELPTAKRTHDWQSHAPERYRTNQTWWIQESAGHMWGSGADLKVSSCSPIGSQAGRTARLTSSHVLPPKYLTTFCTESFVCSLNSATSVHAQTPHSTLCTPHSTLYTSHSTFYTPNPHSTLYTVDSTLHTLHSTLYTPHSTLHAQQFIYTLHFTFHTLHLTLYTSHFTFHTPPFTLYALHSTLYTPHSTLHTLHLTLHTLHFTRVSLLSTLYTPHSTLYPSGFTLHTPTLHTSHCTLHIWYFTLRTHTSHSALYSPRLTLYTPDFTHYILRDCVFSFFMWFCIWVRWFLLFQHVYRMDACRICFNRYTSEGILGLYKGGHIFLLHQARRSASWENRDMTCHAPDRSSQTLPVITMGWPFHAGRPFAMGCVSWQIEGCELSKEGLCPSWLGV